jgi:hypothetical protein
VLVGVLMMGCAGAPLAGHDPAEVGTVPFGSGAFGSWTIDEPGRRFERGLTPSASTLVITDTGFDRVTVIEEPERTIEVGESGSWRLGGGDLRGALLLTPETVTVAVAEGADVRLRTFQPEVGSTHTAALRLVGDRLVLELLEAGRPVGRIAYRRE